MDNDVHGNEEGQRRSEGRYSRVRRGRKPVCRAAPSSRQVHRVSELPLWLSVAVKVVFAATVVVTATAAAEKSGPMIAGLILAMPLSVGPTYVMLALTASPHFISVSAVSSMGANAAVALYVAVYVALARRVPMPVSLSLGLLTWFGAAWLQHRWNPAPVPLLVVSTVFLGTAVLLTRHALAGRKLLAGAKRWYDLPLRALFVGLFAGTVVTVSHLIGPDWTGFLAAFPLVLTTSIVLMHPRVGAAATAAALATAIQGIFIYPLAFYLIHLFSEAWGVWWSFLAAIATIVAWAGLVYAWRTSRRDNRA